VAVLPRRNTAAWGDNSGPQKGLAQASLRFAPARVAAPGRLGTNGPTVTAGISGTDGTPRAPGACLGPAPNISRKLDAMWNGLCTVKRDGLSSRQRFVGRLPAMERRGTPMDETVLQEKIDQLLSAVRQHRGGADVLVADVAKVQTAPAGMRKEMGHLEDNLDHLSLAIKYLMFDLDATKRENRVLRRMLD
jgi:hypothetical protein